MKNNTSGKQSDVAEALEALNGIVGIGWQLRSPPAMDAEASLILNECRLDAGVEFRRHVRRSMLGRLDEQLKEAQARHGIPMVLCTDYVDPRLAKALKDASIPFLDKAGNAYLHAGGVFLYILGQPKPASVHGREKAGRAFQSAGLKLVFALLKNPDLVVVPYRELAEMADISLYAVKCAMDDLRDKGFLVSSGKRRRLRQTKRLLDEWCVAYRDRLRQRLLRGTYQAATVDWWKKVDMGALPACWGGEVAAVEMGLMRHPQTFAVYCGGNVSLLIAAGRLHRQDNGNVELLDTFWGHAESTLAPDLLVYADLITSGIERNIETARELYAQRIEGQFT